MSGLPANIYKILGREGNYLILQPIGRVEHVRDSEVKAGVSQVVAKRTQALPSGLDAVESGLYRRTYRPKGTS